MNITQFEQYISILFGEELLTQIEHEYGFTNKTDDEIRKIGYATNLSLETIEEAKKHDVDLMVTHHDAWDFIYGLKEACIEKLKEYDISHFWIHAPLDYVEFGTCTSLMNVLGVDNIIKYSVYQNNSLPGIGEYNKELSFHELVEKMSEKLKEPIRAWQYNDKAVKKIGVLTGAGNSSDAMKMAVEEGCDTYITGEVNLYTIQYAQFVGINLLVGSHTFTEIFGVESLAYKLKALEPSITLTLLPETHFEVM
ncbi:Nif3-like dinuclear metal center hexameric protein [Metasolibacillus meyeri]|uniref:Nif3-like dinuclear metal center hexameric protein n=1 Tax=Metasolibacillus meyeri TaxID=1071052 RepID=UPI000D2FC342|nr:Nif3-like dinuclear metal center hexameric protein [Metasolibacillus meyeri]